jgi:hypothetical protein
MGAYLPSMFESGEGAKMSPEALMRSSYRMVTTYPAKQRNKQHKQDYALVTGSRQGSRRLPFLDLRLTGFEGGGDDMPITAFNGPGECVVFR